MTDPIILSQLRSKQAEVEIVRLGTRIAEARANLIHIASVIRLFDPKAPDAQPRAYQAVSKAMKRSRLLDLCEAALRSSTEPLDTRQLGQRVIAAEGWDAEDRTLRITVSPGSASCSPSASGEASSSEPASRRAGQGDGVAAGGLSQTEPAKDERGNMTWRLAGR